MTSIAVKSSVYQQAVVIGDWRFLPAAGELVGPQGTLRLEPKVAELLALLVAQPGLPVSREQIMQALWPGQVVGEDSLARAVFKLRQALGDDARSPRYVETLAKRGYRLIVAPVTEALAPEGDDPQCEVPAAAPAAPRSWRSRRSASFALAMLTLAAVVLASSWLAGGSGTPTQAAAGPAAMTARADDFYFQFSRGDNESAIELYERVLSIDADDPHALAGLANALVQRSIRWPDLPGEPSVQFTRLGDALAHGHLDRAPTSRQLGRARQLAERAVALAPGSAAAHKALGFVASAEGRFDASLQAYERAVDIDPLAWGALINIGDVLEIRGQRAEALPFFERAHAAMEQAYHRQPVQIRPWRADVGVLIAQRHIAHGDPLTAEAWYRRVLAHSPLHPAATRGLAGLLHAGGDAAQAHRLCAELTHRVGADAGCAAELRGL
jgi:transcriptional activator of cad operon